MAGFVELERRGMERRRDGDPTLTAVISRYVPGWLLALLWGAFVGWANRHFRLAEDSFRTKPPDVPR